MGLVTGYQPLLQGEALALLCQNLRGVGIGQIGAFGLVGGFLGGQLLAVGVGLPLPCSPRAARHQGQDDQHYPAPLHRIDLHANTLSARAYIAFLSAAPFWPPLTLCRNFHPAFSDDQIRVAHAPASTLLQQALNQNPQLVQVFAVAQSDTRYSRALISYDNPANNYDTDVTAVTDSKLQRRYGDNPLEISAIGCTRESEAQRCGKWALLTNAKDRAVTLRTGLAGRIPLPGYVVPIADELIAGRPVGGLVAAVGGLYCSGRP